MSRINIAASGKFHYLYYAKHLATSGNLKGVYFSHKLSTGREIPKDARKNLFLKEYLLGLHLKVLGETGIHSGLDIYNYFWDIQLRRSFSPAATNIFLIHGNCHRTLKKFQGSGLMVGEVVNAHPADIHRKLEPEAQRLGIERPKPQWTAGRIETELEYVDMLLCPSTTVRDSFVAEGFPSERCIIQPYGVEPLAHDRRSLQAKNVHKRKLEDGSLNILVAGQVTLRKGQHLLLERIKEMCNRKLLRAPKITFAGRADPLYLKAISDIGPKFTHLGHVDRDELLGLFCEYDVLCLPSIEDGFGMVVLEAAQAGLPVLVSKYAGASELVGKNFFGSTFDPFSLESFRLALEQLCAEDAHALDNFQSWKDYAEKLTSTLSNTVS